LRVSACDRLGHSLAVQLESIVWVCSNVEVYQHLKPFFGVRGLDLVLLPLCPADVCLHGRSFTVSPSHFSPTPFTHTSHIHTLLVHTPSSAILMQRTTSHTAAAAPSPADCCSQTTLTGAPSRATSIVESRSHDHRRNDEAMSCKWRSPDERAV
jgi:hypothetical protein